MQRDSRNLSTLGSSTYFDSREEKRPETRTRRSVRIAKKDRVQPCFRKDLERRKGSRMCLERADGCKRVNVQLKPLAWCSFSNNKALPSFSLSLVIFLAFSLPRLLSFSLSLFFCLSLSISLYLSFFLHQIFRNSSLAGDTTKELVDRLCRARVCVGVMIFELSKPSKARAL